MRKKKKKKNERNGRRTRAHRRTCEHGFLLITKLVPVRPNIISERRGATARRDVYNIRYDSRSGLPDDEHSTMSPTRNENEKKKSTVYRSKLLPPPSEPGAGESDPTRHLSNKRRCGPVVGLESAADVTSSSAQATAAAATHVLYYDRYANIPKTGPSPVSVMTVIRITRF